MPQAELELLDLRTRAKWCAWLAKHHKSSRGVWLVFHKAHTGKKSLPCEDFIREARLAPSMTSPTLIATALDVDYPVASEGS